jgi:hypothetical protein
MNALGHRITNVCLAAAAVALATTSVRYYRATSASMSMEIPAGSKLDLAGLQGTHVVVALSTDCHFCAQSAPLYRQLALRAAAAGGRGLLFILPQPIEQGRAYLESLNVPARNVQKGDFRALGVRATPMVILVGPDWRVRKSWIGRLSTQQQEEVLSEMVKTAF